jgi:hypothetical protein
MHNDLHHFLHLLLGKTLDDPNLDRDYLLLNSHLIVSNRLNIIHYLLFYKVYSLVYLIYEENRILMDFEQRMIVFAFESVPDL